MGIEHSLGFQVANRGNCANLEWNAVGACTFRPKGCSPVGGQLAKMQKIQMDCTPWVRQ
jgi:hypothetical protein